MDNYHNKNHHNRSPRPGGVSGAEMVDFLKLRRSQASQCMFVSVCCSVKS